MQRLSLPRYALLPRSVATPSAQSDLDALMLRVLERRDEKLEETAAIYARRARKLQITALAVIRLFGFEREYHLVSPRGFLRPKSSQGRRRRDSEEKRRDAEDRWLRRSQNREERRARQAGEQSGQDGRVGDIIRQSFEPAFIESANFLKFKFDQGRYALVGRERMVERDVLRVEYYPKLLFNDTPMSKVSLVTLWVDPAEHQILRYEFRNIDMDFLPAQWLVRVDGFRAAMQMSEPFPNVWLPASIDARFRMRLATGPLEGRYDVAYTNYRLPEASGRIVP